jgi:uncharacterized protein
MTFEGLPLCRLTEVPLLADGAGAGQPGPAGPARGAGAGQPGVSPAAGGPAALAAALSPALTSAYSGGRPVLVAWVRAVPGGPVAVVLGGDIAVGARDAADGAGPGGDEVRPLYPPGSRGRRLPAAGLDALLAGLPAWLRCCGSADSLAASPLDGPHGTGRIDDLVAHLGGAPFAWLVLAEPVGRDAVGARLAELHYRIGALLDRQATSARDRADLERAQERYRELSQATASGLWNVHVLAGGPDPHGVARSAALLCSASDLAPLPYTLRPHGEAMPLPDALAATVTGPDPDSGGSPFAASAALLCAVARPPLRELPGVRLVEPPAFDVTPETTGGIPLGVVLDGTGAPAGDFAVPAATLNRHAFVAGATGAGKSQTVRHLLEGLHRAGVPWLVIEPAKAEYARMAGRLETGPGAAGAEASGGGVVVIRPGDPDQVAVSLNPLEPEAGFPLQTHIDLVRALFLAAFEANEPFPQVLARALTRCYEDLGWDLALGQSRVAGGTPRYPTLGDLQRVALDVVGGIGYGAEMTADVRGFVDVRLASLRLGTPGRFFEGGHPLDVADLLRRDVVLELEDVGNDQDKAFCMGAVLIRLAEYLRVHQPDGGGRLRHVTVVEEAHRLLRASAAGTPAAHAVELFAALLAEVRAYGEGVVVAEQIPSKLLPDVVKNTALKVLHRLPAADDRETVGATMNLDERQSRHVVALPPGEAAVFADGMDRPVLVRVPLGEGRERVAAEPVTAGVRRTRSQACGPLCRSRACTLREISAGRALAADPRLTLWVELLTVAHVAGERRPRPVPGALSGPVGGHPQRTVQCALAHLAQQAVDLRYRHLLPWYQPELLAAHVAATAACWLYGEPSDCTALSEVDWQAGRYRWVDVGRALAGWRGPRDCPHPDTGRWARRGLDLRAGTVDEQVRLLREHPTRSIPGVVLLFGEEPVLESCVDALSGAADPAQRLAQATAFLEPEGVAWLPRRLLPALTR